MDVAEHIKYITEFLATALLVILGNGAVANVDLKGTKGNNSGWIIIAVGYGLGVMMPALMFGNVSGNHINPAFTIGLAVSGYFKWNLVPGYIAAQLAGAIAGQAVVVGVYRPYFMKTENANHILGSFATISALDDGTTKSRPASWVNGFFNEFFGSFILFFGAMALTKNYFGVEVLDYLTSQGADLSSKSNLIGYTHYLNPGLSVAHLALGFLVMALVASLGGPTGPALNPARDLGPRILHALLPISILGKSKGDSKWWYAWVPVVAPIIAGITAVALFKLLYA